MISMKPLTYLSTRGARINNHQQLDIKLSIGGEEITDWESTFIASHSVIIWK